MARFRLGKSRAAAAHPFWKQKKPTLLFVGPVRQLHGSRGIPTAKTNTLRAEQQDSNGSNRQCGDMMRLCEQGLLKEALDNIYVMDQLGIGVDSNTYASLLQVCVDKKALVQGKLVHAHMIETGFIPDVYLGTKLVIMYAKCGSLADARRILEGMPERNVVTWTAMISACARYGKDEEALTVFYQMQRTGVQPNQHTFASVLPACANRGALEQGKGIHEEVIRSGFQYDSFVGNALVDMYAKCRKLEDARKVFDKMPERDVVSGNAMIAGYAQNGDVDEALKLFQKMPLRNVVSWTSMIAGYAQNENVDEALKLFQKMPERNAVSWTAMVAGFAQNGRFDEALKLFRLMQLKGVKRDPPTYSSVLPACANLAALEHGKAVHEDIIRSGFQSNMFVGNALIDMYAKCGSIRDAGKVFDKMPMRTVVSWNAMILGYAMHGWGEEAIQLFEHMQNSVTKPDRVTFLGLLSACCHAGLVDDAWQYFERMSPDYHITPGVEHYSCMVDLLGRAGCLNEALDFINNMPITPDASVWGSLLGACRIHGNIKLGEWVAERLFELDPKNSAHYVLLSNIYAAAGRWNDKEKVRKMMKDRSVRKMPGRSWIEVNNKVYTFLVGDKSHPQTQEIYEQLEILAGQLKEVGYTPNTNFVLHDVEEEQKEHILCHHSEKLAIAFGLINTPPGMPIRIVKNLRVCGDCHSATKHISKIVTRQIVVRDANRFHLFKDGSCSCGDYW